MWAEVRYSSFQYSIIPLIPLFHRMLSSPEVVCTAHPTNREPATGNYLRSASIRMMTRMETVETAPRTSR